MAKKSTTSAAASKTRSTRSAAPNTSDDKGKKDKKVEKVVFPGLKDGEGNAVKLIEWPADWNKKEHKPLKKSDFENEAVWLDHRADELEAQVAKLRKEAETARKLGSTKQRQQAKKLLAMQDRMAELMAKLKDEGVDVDSLMEANNSDEDGEGEGDE